MRKTHSQTEQARHTIRRMSGRIRECRRLGRDVWSREMKRYRFSFARLLVLAFLLVVSAQSAVLLSPSAAAADKFEIKPVAERKIDKLPAGPLYWQIENFSTLELAQTAA